MSNVNKGRWIGLTLIAILGYAAFYFAKVEISTTFTMTELTTAINSHQVVKGIKVSGLRLESEEPKIRVSFAFAGIHGGLPVEGEAVVIGAPGYGAVRKHFTFSSQEVQITKLVSKGAGAAVAPQTPGRNSPRDITAELGQAVEDAFASLKAHRLHPEDVTAYAWLNSAEVVGQNVTVKWDAVQTTVKTTIVLVLLVIALVITFVWPEFLFWMFFFWMIN